VPRAARPAPHNPTVLTAAPTRVLRSAHVIAMSDDEDFSLKKKKVHDAN
tara:strand:- start:644 stop:790 length:147 start_codon:yes stop_codon:yes gene_type:complete